MLASVEAIVRDAARGAPALTGIGVAAAGQIDPRTGAVVYAPNLDVHDWPLGERLAAAFDVPVRVENDVRAAAWGEHCLGGHRADSLVAVFVGTGIGSGAVLDGALWRGADNGAGEIGHTQVVPDGLPCPCGARGCLEQYASGSGLVRRLRAALAAGTPTRLAEVTGGAADALTVDMVAAAANQGDPLARELWSDATRYLTLALTNSVTLLNPSVLVLGGGVIERSSALFDMVADGVRRTTTVLARRSLRITRARLGDWAGVLGAAVLAASR